MAETVLPSAVSVVGLGYVGLSLASALARKFKVVGFDVDEGRIEELAAGNDRNAMVNHDDLSQASLRFSADPSVLGGADVVIVAVPTPVDQHDEPDITALKMASALVGKHLRHGMIVVYESTVYPGCTEEDCIPILEEASGLTAHRDFGVGYSPERIDPGDVKHGLESLVKVVSAGDSRTLDVLASMYGEVVGAGVHRAPSIRTAEAAKVIENIQRDLNIALMNELSMLFHVMGIETKDVLEAAGTKWNFGRYFPGLVGGHCIPVDPYYLVHKARSVGFDPQVILAGRHTNDQMASYVADQGVALLQKEGVRAEGAQALVLGLTFKEDVRDTRNAQAATVIELLKRRGLEVWSSDPIVRPRDKVGDGFAEDPFSDHKRYDLVVLAVPHKRYRTIAPDAFTELLKHPREGVVMDLRGVLDKAVIERQGATYWTL